MALEKFLGLHIVNPEQRAQFLKNNCEKAEFIDYSRKFTPEEISVMKDNLSDCDLALDAIEDEKKEILSELKERQKKHKTTRKSLLSNIRKKAELVNEQCFAFYDVEQQQVGFYNAEGELVDIRMMKPEERQTSIFTLGAGKTGTND